MSNIRWVVSSSRTLAYGYVPYMPRNKYYIGGLDGYVLIADVRKSNLDWRDINVPCNTLEEAMRWCEMIEATGAY